VIFSIVSPLPLVLGLPAAPAPALLPAADIVLPPLPAIVTGVVALEPPVPPFAVVGCVGVVGVLGVAGVMLDPPEPLVPGVIVLGCADEVGSLSPGVCVSGFSAVSLQAEISSSAVRSANRERL
jgi:hypothetical protein